MPRLQVFIAVGNRSYKNRLSLDGIAARHPPRNEAEVWRVSSMVFGHSAKKGLWME
jgi:hypothetical protein